MWQNKEQKSRLELQKDAKLWKLILFSTIFCIYVKIVQTFYNFCLKKIADKISFL